MNKFTTNEFSEDTAAAAAYDAEREYHAWLDSLEADDRLAMEVEAFEWEELHSELDEHDMRVAEVKAEDLARAQADWEAAQDQGHEWDDYDDPIDLYGAEWENYAIREWD